MKKSFLAIFVCFVIFAANSILPASADTIPDTVVSISILSDGTPDFDAGAADPDQPGGAGLDANANNGIVKTQDSSVITVNWSTGDIAVTNMVLHINLPTGLSFDGLPAACNIDSTLTDDVLVCGLGDQPGGQTGSFEVVVVMGTVENASSYDIVSTVTSDEAPTATSNTVTLIASSGPKANLKIDHSDVSQIESIVNPNTSALGRIFFFPITLEVGGDGKGAEPLNPTQDLNFRLDLSSLPASHELVDNSWAFPAPWTSSERCGPNDRGSSVVPFGTIGNVNSSSFLNSTVDSGDWTCAYNGGLDSIDINVANANLQPNSFPKYGAVPFTPFAPRKVIIAGIVPVFISDADLIAISGLPGVGSTPTVEVSWIADPVGVSGVTNSAEDPSDNQNSSQFEYELPGNGETHYFGEPNRVVFDLGFGLSFFRNNPTLISSLPGHKPFVPTQTQVDNAGDGTVVPGQKFQIELSMGASSSQGKRSAVCTQFSPGQTIAPQADIKVLDLNAVGNLNAFATGVPPLVSYESSGGAIVIAQAFTLIPVGSGIYAPVQKPLLSSDYTVEYSTDIHNNDYDCSDNVYSWSTTLPTDLTTVTQVRVRMNRDISSDESLSFGIGMQALASPIGTKLFETMSAIDWAAGDPFPSTSAWNLNRGTPYTTSDFCTLPGNPPDPTFNDCLTIGGPYLQIDKSVLSSSINLRLGDEIEYQVLGYVVGQEPGVTENVVIDDSLAPGLEFTGESTVAATSGGGDGDTTASWNFGQVANGTTITIKYKARVMPGYDPFENFGNNATINGGYNNGTSIEPLTPQSAGVNVQTAGVFSQVNTLKTTPDPLIPVDGDVLFNLNYINSGTTDLGGVDVIDILPYVGDGRTVPSSFSGTTQLASVTPGGGENILYTIADPSTIDTDGDDGSNAIPGGATTWCEETNVSAAPEFGDVGCPTVVGQATAFRLMRTGTFAVGDSFDAQVVINTSGNEPEDIYTNDFGIRIGGLALPALSNDVSVEVELAKLVVDKTAQSSTIILGSNATYIITITNSGTGPAKDVVIEDSLPNGLEYVSASDSAVNNDGTVTWTIDSIEPGETKTLTIVAKTKSINSELVNEVRIVSSSTPLSISSIREDDAKVSVLSETITVAGFLPSTGGFVLQLLYGAILLIASGLLIRRSQLKV